MRICSMPGCQTTAGCKCQPPTGVSIPPITSEHAWKAAYELAKAENARLKAALAIFLGDKTLADMLWGDLPDDSAVNITIKLGAYRQAQAAAGHG